MAGTACDPGLLDHDSSVRGIRYQRPVWTVYRMWTNDEGRVDDARDVGKFWEQSRAESAAARLNDANTDPAVEYIVSESEAFGYYPADEEPPWVSDPDRRKKRGYEAPPLG
jgi:hypothetical protein